jgi:hypothetical protein
VTIREFSILNGKISAIMQRRNFIRLSALGGAAVGLSGIHCKHRYAAVYDVLERPRQLSIICDAKTIREIGRVYQLLRPADPDADMLAENLLSDSPGRAVSVTADAQFIQKLIDKKTEQDFENGNIIEIKGWILAETEARQCALYFVNNQ